MNIYHEPVAQQEKPMLSRKDAIAAVVPGKVLTVESTKSGEGDVVVLNSVKKTDIVFPAVWVSTKNSDNLVPFKMNGKTLYVNPGKYVTIRLDTILAVKGEADKESVDKIRIGTANAILGEDFLKEPLDKVSSLEKKLAEKEKDYDELSKAFGSMGDKKAEADKTIKEMTFEHDDLLSKYKDLSNRNNDLSVENENLKHKLSEISEKEESDISVLKEQNKALLSENERLKRNNVTLKDSEELVKLKEENQRLKDKLLDIFMKHSELTSL